MDLSNLGVESLAIGAIAGYFTGYLIKKLLHLAVTIGIFVFLLMYMVHIEVIDFNLEEIGATISGYASLLLDRLEMATLLSNSPFVGSFVIGLLLGWKKY